ncbi:MAG: fused signal recognition particle receptor [Candidatus Midichloriaceae bacterium]
MKQWFSKLKGTLSKSSENFNGKLKSIFSLNRPNKEILDELEEVLIMSDLGVEFSQNIISEISKTHFDEKITQEAVKSTISNKINEILKDFEKELVLDNNNKPFSILVSGINGGGKTTSIGKIANRFQKLGKKVLIVAADTFRASAKEQLEIWAKKANCDIFCGEDLSEPASVVYKGVDKGIKEKYDVIIVDTAGRMHNKAVLMEELQKIKKVMHKLDNSFPNLNLLVLDATIGQIALKQVEIFNNAVDVNGIILTKLDGTSKAGIILPITQKFKIPIYYVGVGEGIEDINCFSAKEFSEALL